jgi:hypothetical protein
MRANQPGAMSTGEMCSAGTEFSGEGRGAVAVGDLEVEQPLAGPARRPSLADLDHAGD